MKKSYTRPTIEKVRFNYRDQVVAASGVAVNNNNTSNLPEGVEQILDSLGEIGDVIRDIINRYL